MKSNCLKNSSHPSESTFIKSFDLPENLIILEGDKNIGYVCLQTTELLNQYVKINLQQHFGKTSISDSWYITNILNFIRDAKSNLPTELSNIIYPSDFVSIIVKPEIGVLRLQPKVLKLNPISYENIEKLTSRGIKSSLRDLIKVIQKILDKIFNHLLYFIEE